MGAKTGGIAGVPLQQVFGEKGLDEYLEDAAVAHPHEVEVQAGEDGELQVKGPVTTVGGKTHEELQLNFGTFDDWEEEMKASVLLTVQKQVSTRIRLLEMQLDNLVTNQGGEAKSKKMQDKLKRKKLNAMAKSGVDGLHEERSP